MIMIDQFMPVKKFLKSDNITTDNNVFRLHYKFTVLMLLVFTLMVTSKQFFGDPIHCIGDNDKNVDAINNYCWIFGTYTMRSKLVGNPGQHNSYPGVGPVAIEDDSEIKHTYYQWVCFVLLGQAVMFYIPRYLWKMWENGRMETLTAALGNPLITKEDARDQIKQLLYYLSHSKYHSHNLYALRYAFCEILNLVNSIGQIFLLDVFLGGAFRTYGASVVFQRQRVPNENEDYLDVNPMDRFFPKMTKCWIRSYGPSGSVELKDRMCVLPLNIVNEKIFVVLWFWLLVLSMFSMLSVFFRVIVLSFPPLRTMLIMGQLRFTKRKVVLKIVRVCSFGDWFVLYLLGKNMNPVAYKDLLLELSKVIPDYSDNDEDVDKHPDGICF